MRYGISTESDLGKRGNRKQELRITLKGLGQIEPYAKP